MPVSDVKRLLCASLVAEILLDGRTDRQGRPLIEHSRRVMARCTSPGFSVDQRIAAVLHDVAEGHEAPTTIIGLVETLFGFDVANMVDYLTRRPNATYHQYVRCLLDLPAAIPIKLADLEDNLDSSRGPIPDSLRQRYERALEYLRSVQPTGEKEADL